VGYLKTVRNEADYEAGELYAGETLRCIRRQLVSRFTLAKSTTREFKSIERLHKGKKTM